MVRPNNRDKNTLLQAWSCHSFCRLTLVIRKINVFVFVNPQILTEIFFYLWQGWPVNHLNTWKDYLAGGRAFSKPLGFLIECQTNAKTLFFALFWVEGTELVKIVQNTAVTTSAPATPLGTHNRSDVGKLYSRYIFSNLSFSVQRICVKRFFPCLS